MKPKTVSILKYLTILLIIVVAYIAGIQTGHRIGVRQVAAKHEFATPNMSNADLLVWANEAAVAVLTINYSSYQRQLEDASQYFTPQGWKLYMGALAKSKQLEQIIKANMIVTAVAVGTPRILTQGKHKNNYSWKVQLPMLLTYASANQRMQQKQMVSMLIERTPSYQGKRGVGIVSFNSKEQTS